MKRFLMPLIAIMVLFCVSCGTDNGNGHGNIVGMWERDGGRFIYVFAEDNTGVFYYSEICGEETLCLENTMSFTWWVDGDILCVAPNDCGVFRLSGDNLHWDGTWKRIYTLPNFN